MQGLVLKHLTRKNSFPGDGYLLLDEEIADEAEVKLTRSYWALP